MLLWTSPSVRISKRNLHVIGLVQNIVCRPKHNQNPLELPVRGSGGKKYFFSNTSQTTFECFKLLYYVPIWCPENFAEKKWPEPTHWVPQTWMCFTLTKWLILHSILSPFFKSQSTSMRIILSMSNCVYICLEEECKVLRPDSNTKWVIRATSGVADTANKTPNLSTVYTGVQEPPGIKNHSLN